jgi:hypothetical protein
LNIDASNIYQDIEDAYEFVYRIGVGNINDQVNTYVRKYESSLPEKEQLEITAKEKKHLGTKKLNQKVEIKIYNLREIFER